MSRILTALTLAIAVLAGTSVRADDWPQWRGPNRDGVWRETGILESIPAGGLKYRWRARVSNGYSGPSVARGRVYVTDRQPTAAVERVLCFDEETGKALWVHAYPCEYQDAEYGNGPRASPTIHDGKVYTLGTMGHLFCLDAADGTVVWSKDLVRDYDAQRPRYGVSAAPLIEGDLLIVCAGGRPDATVMAFHRLTGAFVWKALADRPAYSAPVIITAGNVRQLVAWTADNVTGLEPATGQTLWQVPFKTTFDPAQATASPVWHKNLLLFLGAWNRGSLMLKFDPGKPEAAVHWRTRNQPTTMISTPYFLDDSHFCGIDGAGNLFCADASTGDERWSTRETAGAQLGTAHLTPNGDRVFLFNQQGHLIAAKVTPQGYQEFGRCLLVEPTPGYRPQGPVAWSHPAYAYKCVFARNDRELVCASLAVDQVFDAEPPQAVAQARQLDEFSERNAALALAYSPDGQSLALATWSGNIKLIEPSSGKELATPTKHSDWACSVAFSPDGKLLASAGGNEFMATAKNYQRAAEVRVWDVAGGAERGRLVGHTSRVFAAAFSPDGATLATASADRTVRLWDVATMKERALLEGHGDAVSSVAYSSDGATLASASWDRTVKLWDAATLKERATLKGHDEEILALAISPDGRTMATAGADWTVRLWDLAAQEQRYVLNGHKGTVYAAVFSSDGRTLATGSGDETVRLWDVSTGTERQILRGHRSGVVAVSFSRDDTGHRRNERRGSALGHVEMKIAGVIPADEDLRALRH
jgi:WD40 repeat protein/outer membrane protein assembly factor BamB